MIKTTNYDQFTFRDDNRDKGVDPHHLKKIIESIRSVNMLEFRPICVNKEMEVIDGQHRLMAAKELGVEIYYQIKKDFKPEDIIHMNIAKVWGYPDYLNYYVKQGNENYIKLKAFMDEHKINLKIALSLCEGSAKMMYDRFKIGQFIFNSDSSSVDIELIWETIERIKKFNGFSIYTSSTKFWKAMITLIRHGEFNEAQWFSNVDKLVSRFGVRASHGDYLRMIQDIYNYRSSTKINLLGSQDL